MSAPGPERRGKAFHGPRGLAQGSAAFDVAFFSAGAKTISVRDADDSERKADLAVSVSGTGAAAAPDAGATASPTPTATAAPTATPATTPVPTATRAATSTATATATAAPSAGTPAPLPTVTATASATAIATATPRPQAATMSSGTGAGTDLPLLLAGERGPLPSGAAGPAPARSLLVNPSFAITWNTTTTNAGVYLTATVTALDAGGNRDSGYRGTVQFTSTDPAVLPTAAYRYTYTAGDAGQHAFTVIFNTAGTAQTITSPTR